jgi:hypothetical protein
MVEMGNTYKILVEKREGKKYLGDLEKNGRIKQTLRKQGVRVWTGFI